jgi:hypothetical protein
MPNVLSRIWAAETFVVRPSVLIYMMTATLTIIAVMSAATIERIATGGMTVSGTIVIEMNATAATIATTVTEKKGLPSGAIGRVLLPVVAKMIVAPGHLPLGGISKIKGLQGTTAGMIAVATKSKNVSMTGLPDTTGTAGGVEGGCRVVVPSKMKGTERATGPPRRMRTSCFHQLSLPLFSRVSPVELLPC